MSILGQRAQPPRWSGLPLARTGRPYFLLGQDAHGLWVIRESTGRKSGVFTSRAAALRFARLESSDAHFAVVHVNGVVEFDYAAQHL